MLPRLLSDILNHADRNPQGLAILGPSGGTTFLELSRRINAIAAALSPLSFGITLIVGHKEADTVAAMLACAISGRPFVFVDRSIPNERRRQIAEIAEASLVVGMSEKDCEFSREHIAVSTVGNGNETYSFARSVSDADTFYIAFTSGSTGEPKGVSITHSNFAALCEWYVPYLRNAPDGVAHVNHASLSFDMGMLDIWPALALGRPIIMLDHRDNILTQNNISLLQSRPDMNPGVWFSTPSMLMIMCSNQNFNEHNLPHLQWFFVGGEVVQKSLLRSLWDRFPSANIIHAYGPTEATCITHTEPLGRDSLLVDGALSLGPIRGRNHVTIIDSNGLAVAAGTIGEVELSGAQVGLGYLPKCHPANKAFSERNGERVYRTGDRGIVDENGNLFLLGRIDNQVKWNGQRIELDEIARLASAMPDVAEAICTPVLKDRRVTDLVLFIRPIEGTVLERKTVIEALQKRLSAAVTPRDIRIVQKMPTTLSGKIDARALVSQTHTALMARAEENA